jgi:hypothetical protein
MAGREVLAREASGGAGPLEGQTADSGQTSSRGW